MVTFVTSQRLNDKSAVPMFTVYCTIKSFTWFKGVVSFMMKYKLKMNTGSPVRQNRIRTLDTAKVAKC